MSVASTDFDRFYSREEYRQWYDAQPRGRFGRIEGRIVAMPPERVGHARIIFKGPIEMAPPGITITVEELYAPG